MLNFRKITANELRSGKPIFEFRPPTKDDAGDAGALNGARGLALLSTAFKQSEKEKRELSLLRPYANPTYRNEDSNLPVNVYNFIRSNNLTDSWVIVATADPLFPAAQTNTGANTLVPDFSFGNIEGTKDSTIIHHLTDSYITCCLRYRRNILPMQVVTFHCYW
jgi:hypothetical protein